MFIVRLLRWLRGAVGFRAENGSAERLMTLCAKNGVPLWNCRRTGLSVITGYTTVFGYRRMHRLARKAGVLTRVTERQGAPFLLHRYRKRAGILAGLVLFTVFLAVMQQFIWVIEVEGCKNLEPQHILSDLEELGVTRGTWKRSVDPQEVKRQLLMKTEDLSWAALNLHGTTATLLVRERTRPPEKIANGVPANVVARYDGYIKRLEVRNGKAVLRAGDTVRAGELIVSGVFEDGSGSTRLVRADARVLAHVPETLEVRVPLIQKSCRLTGQVTKRNYAQIFGAKIPLFLYRRLDKPCKIEHRIYTPSLFGLTMPFEIESEHYLFYEEEEFTLSETSALRIAKRRLDVLERKQNFEKIIDRSIQAVCENGELILRADYLLEEDIARQVEITVLDREKQGDSLQ